MKYFQEQNRVIENLEVENVLMREDNNFLEGFYYDPEVKAFYESVGLYNKSSVHKLIPKAPESNDLVVDAQQDHDLPAQYFGEGLALRSPTEFALLTYRERRVLIVDRQTMRIKNGLTYPIPSNLKEGWGMTSD